jgi:hypothetical protein
MEDDRFWELINLPAAWLKNGIVEKMMNIYWLKCEELYTALRDADVLVDMPDSEIPRVISGVIWRGKWCFDSVVAMPTVLADVDMSAYYNLHAQLPDSYLAVVDDDFPWER